QLSLAQMSRGEHMMYIVVGQNDRVPEDTPVPQSTVVSGTHYDLHDDPTSGRGEILLHRDGHWHGELTALDENKKPIGKFSYAETCKPSNSQTFQFTVEGGAFDKTTRRFSLSTNGWQAWATDNSEIV